MRRLFLSTLVALACKSADGEQASVGRVEVRWGDSTRQAQLSAPAEARWCARDSMLEVMAFRNDSGIGFALYARDSLRAEGYPLFQAPIFAPWRPQATAALRLLTPTELRGYESTWGQVVVTDAGPGGVSGTLDLHFKLMTGTDSLHVTGSFSGVRILPAAASCGRANKPSRG